MFIYNLYIRMGLLFSLEEIIKDLILYFFLKNVRYSQKLNNLIEKLMSLLCLIMIILVLVGIEAIGMLPIAAKAIIIFTNNCVFLVM